MSEGALRGLWNDLLCQDREGGCKQDFPVRAEPDCPTIDTRLYVGPDGAGEVLVRDATFAGSLRGRTRVTRVRSRALTDPSHPWLL